MAPEIIENNTYSEKSDVYAFSILLWEIIVNEPPYKDLSNVVEIIKRVLSN